MTTTDQLKSFRTADLIAGLEGGAFLGDLVLCGAAETIVRASERRSDLMQLLTAPSSPPAIRRRVARYLTDADLDIGDVQILADMIVRQSLEPDTDLVRHLVACVGPHARKHISRSKCVTVIERLLDAPGLDRHARAEVLRALAEVAEVHDIERLLARTYRSENELALVGIIAQRVLQRPLFIRRLSPSAFEDLVCRVLDARERSVGRSTRFRVCGKPYDGGVDGRGGDLYAAGAEDLGETTVVLQCKNTSRFSMQHLDKFDADVDRERKKEVVSPRLRASPVPLRIFATAAIPKNAKETIRAARDRGIELITGRMLVNMVKEFLGREATLART